MNTENHPSSHIKNQLIAIGLGWTVAGALEAWAYIALAWAIIHQQTPGTVLLCALISVVVTVVIQRSSFYVGVRLAGTLYDVLGKALSQAKLSWFTEQNRALIGTVAGRNIPGLMSFPPHQIQAFIYAILIPIALVVSMVWLANGWIASCIAVLLIGSFLIQFFSQKKLIHQDSKRQALESNSARSALELLEHLEILRTATGPDKAIKRVESSWAHEEEALSRTNSATALAMFSSMLAGILPLAGLLAIWLLEGFDSSYLGLALIMLTLRAAAPLDALAHAGLGINNLRAGLDNYRRATRVPTLQEPYTGAQVSPVNNDIEIRQVTYGPVLNNLNAQIPEGSRVLVSGRSGTGKSTLLELLMRFDDPEKGSITVGGFELSRMRHSDLIKRIAYVSQNPIVFTGTLAENIRLGRSDASNDEILQIAQMVSLGEVIERSELGIHQSVGLHGSALSGGECQRVSIARALIKNAPILILDEATSALDEDTERKIAEAIRILPSTVIITTHRNADIWQANINIELINP
ncbi:ABC transporter ATP-binding protein [Pseudomonas aeruginosa]|uniref:ATP-binding cassette domain-containing protein n=1 Tax=Pseudomonas TaxID=286 RepID=UPI0013E0A8EE|nr:ABC transporter ATP-binding protein [Pseudomonas aeruginosa]WOU21157.1 ABC transporter ATP-binding protein [Pseudomonas aeruginosa]WOU34831.1 ABC transporter ATP-binding protein [Pseudomonas aeruginosa]